MILLRSRTAHDGWFSMTTYHVSTRRYGPTYCWVPGFSPEKCCFGMAIPRLSNMTEGILQCKEKAGPGMGSMKFAIFSSSPCTTRSFIGLILGVFYLNSQLMKHINVECFTETRWKFSTRAKPGLSAAPGGHPNVVTWDEKHLHVECFCSTRAVVFVLDFSFFFFFTRTQSYCVYIYIYSII